METIAEKLQYTSNAVNDIQTAINEKGIEVDNSIELGYYGDKIREIKICSGNEIEIATTEKAGIVKPDGKTIKISEDGEIVGASSSFTGTMEEFEAASLAGEIEVGTIVNITDDYQEISNKNVEIDNILSSKSENPVQNKIITNYLKENVLYLGFFNIYESELDTIAQDLNVTDNKPYILSIHPKVIAEGDYLQNGGSHVVLGIEYGNYSFGSQYSFGSSGIKKRHKEYGSNSWSEWISPFNSENLSEDIVNGFKGDKESSYRRGYVELHPYDISAVSDYHHTIDLSSGYDNNTWYPCILEHLPTDRQSRIEVGVWGGNASVPSWSNHVEGFQCHLDILTIGGGWGATTAKVMYLDDQFRFVSDNKPPVKYKQLHNSSYPVLYLRGGGKYFVWTSYRFYNNIQIVTDKFEVNGETVMPLPTPPSNEANYGNIWTDLVANNAHINHRLSVSSPIVGAAPIYTILNKQLSGGDSYDNSVYHFLDYAALIINAYNGTWKNAKETRGNQTATIIWTPSVSANNCQIPNAGQMNYAPSTGKITIMGSTNYNIEILGLFKYN
ncbi:hypothetical protein D7V86_03395 [bacterium D16-51]|nr:hypothetical protein D7V96_00525 [bacterium D16-59]RKI61853.1 hypothetical protein D7V86_03395 [bacterium D16-51]